MLDERTFALYTDHASAHSEIESAPVLTYGTLAFFLEYNIVVHYRPGKNNIIADALSRRPDYDPWSALNRQEVDDNEDDDRCTMCVSLNLTRVCPESCLFDKNVAAYASDPDYAEFIAYLRGPSNVALEA